MYYFLKLLKTSLRGPTGFFTHTCILCKRTRSVAITAASVVFPAKAKTLGLWHKLAFYLEISSLDFLTEEESPPPLSLLLLMFTPHCPRQLIPVFCCSSFTKWVFMSSLPKSWIPSGQGQSEQGISQEGNFLRKVMKNGTILNNQLKCSFFTWQKPCYKFVFFFFLREVISSALVALKCSFLWAKSWCILPSVAVSHNLYSAFLLRTLLEKEKI